MDLAAGTLRAIALVGLAAGAARADELPRAGGRRPEPRVPPFLEPLRVASNGALQHLAYVPEMEGGSPLAADEGRASWRAGAAHTAIPESVPGNRLKVTTYEAALGGAFGLRRLLRLDGDLEIRAQLVAHAVEAGDVDEDLRATNDGRDVIPDDAAGRPGFSEVHAGLKFAVPGLADLASPSVVLAASFLVSGKASIGGERRFLATGRAEVFGGVAASAGFRTGAVSALPAFWIHVFAGGVWRDREDAVFDEDVVVNGGAVYGAALAWPVADGAALLLQAQGHTNPFRDLDDFSEDPLSIHAGGRVLVSGVLVEAAGGTGLVRGNGPDWTLDFAVVYTF
ncbi:MAG: hypothetical protein L0216_08820 [Planctomycetales bacterium]|nr:hypothetical protein [Planctomycetales bacterium]